MKKTVLLLTVALVAAPLALTAQSYSSSSSLVAPAAFPEGGAGGGGAAATPTSRRSAEPFSEVALGAGISSLGVQLQAATNLSSHFNLRGTGSIFTYTDNFTKSGLNADAKLNLASAGAALDVYPFRVGFRLSPGVLFYNQNQLTAAVNVAGGTSFKLNGTTYWSDNATPVTGTGTLGLNANKAAFTITTGWGNMIPRKGHFSVPFELGVAVTGSPTVNVNLGGTACLERNQSCYIPVLRGAVGLFWRFPRRLGDGTTLLG